MKLNSSDCLVFQANKKALPLIGTEGFLLHSQDAFFEAFFGHVESKILREHSFDLHLLIYYNEVSEEGSLRMLCAEARVFGLLLLLRENCLRAGRIWRVLFLL